VGDGAQLKIITEKFQFALQAVGQQQETLLDVLFWSVQLGQHLRALHQLHGYASYSRLVSII
jgi:hypothetical protein